MTEKFIYCDGDTLDLGEWGVVASFSNYCEIRHKIGRFIFRDQEFKWYYISEEDAAGYVINSYGDENLHKSLEKHKNGKLVLSSYCFPLRFRSVIPLEIEKIFGGEEVCIQANTSYHCGIVYKFTLENDLMYVLEIGSNHPFLLVHEDDIDKEYRNRRLERLNGQRE